MRTTIQVATVATRSTELCRASEINARLPIATPTTNLIAAMLALAIIETVAILVFELEAAGCIRGGLAVRHPG
ncbi:MAG: hypothetical protein NTAFB05_16370 [Nitrobacter sp.]